MDAAERLRDLYADFNVRDVDAVLAATTKDVDWPNAWEGGRAIGQAAVRDYWARQWAAIDPQVQPEAIRSLADGRIEVTVHQIVRDLAGKVLTDGHVRHVYTLRDGLVERMEVEEGDE